jgi:hypothetical protein
MEKLKPVCGQNAVRTEYVLGYRERNTERVKQGKEGGLKKGMVEGRKG